jgi:membrane protein DedA with SNARE-associated domain
MIEHVVANIFHWFSNLGITGAFLSMLIENIGVPLPTEVGYLIGQDLVNTGRMDYFVVLAILTLGHLLGALISYFVGVYGGNFIKDKFKNNQKLNNVDRKVRRWYKKYGNITVFATRFVGYVRPWSSFVAGFAGVPIKPFIFWTALGSLIFNILTLYFTGIILFIWRKYAGLHFLIVSIGFILFFAIVIFELIKHFWLKRK